MGRIAILDEDTVGQIAAGEVIERPVSVVKELLENSIDAGATRIGVVVEEGGLRRITVSDDGCGMGREDAVLALERHATSKIRTARDLCHVRTLGFRGEALASIAAVSAVDLTTRPAGADAGTRLLARGGVITHMEEVGAPPGTCVTVRDLFFNAPVRRRYLRSPGTELGHIADCVSQCAVAHPEIAFRLTHSGETVVQHGGSGSLMDAVVAVFGAEAARQMLEVDVPGEWCALRGVLSRPAFTRGTRGWQWCFVNGRPVRSRVLMHAVEQAYHTLVLPGRFPVVVLLLSLDPMLADANVHPAKSEVRFLHEGEVHRFVCRALRETLESADLTPHLTLAGSAPPLAGALHEAGGDSGHGENRADAPGGEAPLPLLPLEPAAEEAPEARAQLHNTYILAENEEGLVIIDQHTAHERALFEQLLHGVPGDAVRPLGLTVPFVVSFGAREAAAVRAHLDPLRAIGFALEPFGRNAFLVRSVPAALAHCDCESVLRDTVEELLGDGSPQGVTGRFERIVSLVACRSAVKAGDRLTLQEMQAIIRGLYRLHSRFTCQHGRPTVVVLSKDELQRRFHRA